MTQAQNRIRMRSIYRSNPRRNASIPDDDDNRTAYHTASRLADTIAAATPHGSHTARQPHRSHTAAIPQPYRTRTRTPVLPKADADTTLESGVVL
jgi:hypothetical protein